MKITKICEFLEMTRQNYYKRRTRRAREHEDHSVLKEMVLRERKIQPREGGRKLHKRLSGQMRENGIYMCRDKFFNFLDQEDFLLKPLPKQPRTTNSRHSLPVFTNQIKDMAITAPNQVWVSDITYLRTDKGFMYLSLIMDVASRYIVGYHCSDSLETEGCLRSLTMALRMLPDGVKPIHHSDRGSQYCSHMYTNMLRENGLEISMTEHLHCYENSLAERLNGILKQEYGLYFRFKSKVQTLEAVKQAIFLYNTYRLHKSIDYCTPESVYKKTG